MTDTPDYISKKQLEIWLAKPVAERFRLACEAIDEVNAQTEQRIRNHHPGISEGDLRAEFIRQNYKDQLDPAYMEDIIKWVKEKYKDKAEHNIPS